MVDAIIRYYIIYVICGHQHILRMCTKNQIDHSDGEIQIVNDRNKRVKLNKTVLQKVDIKCIV